MISRLNGLVLVAAIGVAGCQKSPAPPASVKPQAPATTIEQVPGHQGLAQDNTKKEEPRLVPAEAFVRTYLSLFGYLTPGEFQTKEFPGGYNGLFNTWQQYVTALGLPTYATDLPRVEETNLIMVAAFERVGIALCDKALEKDLKSNTPMEQRKIYAFDLPPGDPKVPQSGVLDRAAFAPRFDVLHTTFLGYPAALAPTDRESRFFDVYTRVAAMHDATKSKFTATEAGMAAVCYGLIRHPEFHLY